MNKSMFRYSNYCADSIPSEIAREVLEAHEGERTPHSGEASASVERVARSDSMTVARCAPSRSPGDAKADASLNSQKDPFPAHQINQKVTSDCWEGENEYWDECEVVNGDKYDLHGVVQALPKRSINRTWKGGNKHYGASKVRNGDEISYNTNVY
jgi:hypothetical protein